MKKIIYFIILFVFPTIFLSFTNDDYEDYIKNNYKPLKISENNGIDNIVDFSLLDEDIEKSKIILSGEYHYIKYNYLLKFELLKYLNKKFNVKYLWVEASYSFSKMVNHYLITGDDKYLKRIVIPAEMEFYKKIYNYNKTTNYKIEVFGFDPHLNINEIYSVTWYLYSIFKEKLLSDEIKDYIKIINKYYKYFCEEINVLDDEDVYNNLNSIIKKEDEFFIFIINFKKNVDKNINLYKKVLKSEFNEFYKIINYQIENYNLFKKFNSLTSEKYFESRDRLVYKRFLDYFKTKLDKNSKIFGQFGFYHVIQKDTKFKNLPFFLNSKGSIFKNQILSIRYIYLNCLAGSNPGEYFDNSYGIEVKSDFIEILKKYSKTDFTLFKLTGKNSPFSRKGNLVIYYPKYLQKDVSTTDFYQYIIVVKNSPEF